MNLESGTGSIKKSIVFFATVNTNGKSLWSSFDATINSNNSIEYSEMSCDNLPHSCSALASLLNAFAASVYNAACM